MELKAFIAKCSVETKKAHWFYSLEEYINKSEMRKKDWRCPSCTPQEEKEASSEVNEEEQDGDGRAAKMTVVEEGMKGEGKK